MNDLMEEQTMKLSSSKKPSNAPVKLSVRTMMPIIMASMLALGVAVMASTSVRAALSCINDTAGANDEPGQKDLTQLCLDNSGLPFTLQVTWNWDEISVSGA